MDDSEKPFACPSPGCSMSFTNEDHLVVHRKKHDMVLNLGNNGKPTFVADQTPTPTRFIRNCEEVGLFQDLQNVNPFEETFRRAVEAGTNGTISESEIDGTDDTLHTPHIFPNIGDVQSSVVVATAVTKKGKDFVSVDDKNHSTQIRDNFEESRDVKIIVESKERVEISSKGIVAQDVESRVTPEVIEGTRASPNLTINGQEVLLLLKTGDGTLMQLSAIPINENRNENHRLEGAKLRNREVDGRGVKKVENNGVVDSSTDSRLTLAKMRLKEILKRNDSTVGSSTTKNSPGVGEKSKSNKSKEKINVEQRRKQEVLDRNRESSMRARAKRKAWIQQLQKTASNANERNANLQLEVKALKNEVAKLRALLLVHTNCPVTKAMEKGSLIIVESNETQSIVPTIQNVDNKTTGELFCRKRGANTVDTPIAPKITKSKHHAILPKVNSVKDLPILKINEIGSLTKERESPKRIVLVDNLPKRLEYVMSTSRSMTQMNPTILRIDNAASKCTGT